MSILRFFAVDLNVQARILRSQIAAHSHTTQGHSSPDPFVQVMDHLGNRLTFLTETICKDPVIYNHPKAYSILEQAALIEREASPSRIIDAFQHCHAGASQCTELMNFAAGHCEALALCLNTLC